MNEVRNESDPPYVLGHSQRELERLRTQAIWLEPVTRRILEDAGIAPGMRVLDVGSGTGGVSFLAAELVGSTGQVVGVDLAAPAVAAATRAAKQRHLHHVHFCQGDPAMMRFDSRFDAVVGRYVLPFQADPAALLSRLTRHLVAGGLLAFHEPDFSCVRSLPPVPLYDQACGWIVSATRLSGQSWSFLDQIAPAFARAELPAPTLRMNTYVATAPRCQKWLNAIGDMVESLLPAIERHQLATAAEVDIATLRDRLWSEVTGRDAMVVGRSEIGIWTRID